ncbi:hypothetical protein EG329_002459 [Mollisiaceae sp. DMI_Dod_QoI]|nr:hypothetical protein EG329_002459 [Helotiales sp. DMI_Dod_QoI]
MRSSKLSCLIALGLGFLSGSWADDPKSTDYCNQFGASLGMPLHGDIDGVTISCYQATTSQQQVLEATQDNFRPLAASKTSTGTSFTPYPSDLIRELSSSLLACQNSTTSTLESFTFNPPSITISGSARPSLPACPPRPPGGTLSPLGCTEISGTTLSQSVPQTSVITTTSQSSSSPNFVIVPTPTSTKAMNLVTPQADHKRTLSNLPRQQLTPTIITLSLQSSSADRSLHVEPEPTIRMTTGTMSSSPAATTTSKSGASLSKSPPKFFMLFCILFALLLVSPSLASSQSSPTPCKADPVNGCSTTTPAIALMATTSIPSSTPGNPSRCADDSSALCLGTVSVGSFAAPPTAPSSTQAITSVSPTSNPTSTHSAEMSIPTSIVESASQCAGNHNFLCVGSVTEGSFAPPPTAGPSSAAVSFTGASSAYSITSIQPTSSPPNTSPLQTSPIDSNTIKTTIESSEVALTSTVQSTTTLPQSTIVSTSVLTHSPSATASLQSAGTLSKRPPVFFLVLSRLLALFSTTSGEWTTKSLPVMQTFCTEDPTHGCVNGTPVTELYLTNKATNTTRTSIIRQITPTPCSEDPSDGCIGTTPVSQYWTSTPMAQLPPITSHIAPCSEDLIKWCTYYSTVPINSSHTQMPFAPPSSISPISVVVTGPCASDREKICIATSLATPSPCASDEQELCIGTAVLSAKSSSQSLTLTTTQSPTTAQSSSTAQSPTTTQSSTTAQPSTTGSTSSTSSSTSTSTAKSGGTSNQQPPPILFLLSKLFM